MIKKSRALHPNFSILKKVNTKGCFKCLFTLFEVETTKYERKDERSQLEQNEENSFSHREYVTWEKVTCHTVLEANFIKKKYRKLAAVNI